MSGLWQFLKWRKIRRWVCCRLPWILKSSTTSSADQAYPGPSCSELYLAEETLPKTESKEWSVTNKAILNTKAEASKKDDVGGEQQAQKALCLCSYHLILDEICFPFRNLTEYFFLRVNSSFRTKEQVTESELKFHTPSKSFFIIQ